MKKEHFSLALFLATAYAIYLLYSPFWMNIIIAILLAISTYHMQSFFLKSTKSNFFASLLSTTVLTLLFFAPLGYFLSQMTKLLRKIDISKIKTAEATIKEWLENVPSQMVPIKEYAEQIIYKIDPASLSQNAISYASKAGSFTLSFISSALLILIFYFFALYYAKDLYNFFIKLSNMPQSESDFISKKMRCGMSVVFYSILVTAIFEGILFGLAVEYMGYNGLLFGIMYGFASLIPVVGGAIMWLPFALYELSLGNLANAIFISLYTIIVISIIADTFIKPIIIKLISTKIIKSKESLNELVIFFAIIAGLATFGFWGMILGPAITVLFISLIKLNEFKQSS